MKNFYSLISILFVCFLFLLSCSGERTLRQKEWQKWIQDNDKVKVLSTTAMIHDLVKHVGGEYVDSLTLIQGSLDPHSYQMVKGDDEKFAYADIIFHNGLGLEHGPSMHQHLTHNPKAVALGDALERQDPSAIIYIDGEKDPHIWMDISLWEKMVPFIVEALSQKDSIHAQEFNANAESLRQEMARVHHEVRETLHQIPADKRYLVTSHDAFNYFSRAYLSEDGEIETDEWRKRFDAPEGLAPESQLSATDIRKMIDYMKKYHIQLLFPESNVSRDSIKKILQAGREQGLNLQIACCPLYGDAMGEPGSEADSYLKMIKHNAKMLVQHMNPNPHSVDEATHSP